MLWRAAGLFILLFWSVMTGLVIRDAYFPAESRFATVPPAWVLEQFLAAPSATGGTLHILRDGEKLGHASFSARRQEAATPGGRASFAVLLNGTLRAPLGGEQLMETGFRMTAELEDAGNWKSLQARVSIPDAETEARIDWRGAARLPEVEVRRAGQVVMDSAGLAALLPMAGGLSPMAAKGGPPPQVTAREGMLTLAGRSRRCYVITAGAGPGWQAMLYFTELGEIARVDLPGGWQMIEPMMHALEK